MNNDIINLCKNRSIDTAKLLSFLSVETGGIGFAPNGKIIIQFEPSWFRKKQPFAPTGAWNVNRVDIQSKEWEAFNNAYSINSQAAMESTSIGLGQILGLHYKRLGFKSVNDMWDNAKLGIEQQILQVIKFIETDNHLLTALNECNWHLVATYYNGARYRQLAEKIGREPYDISMRKAYDKYSKIVF